MSKRKKIENYADYYYKRKEERRNMENNIQKMDEVYDLNKNYLRGEKQNSSHIVCALEELNNKNMN